MTVRRRQNRDNPPAELPGDFSSPINMAIAASGAIAQPDALTVQSIPLTAADIFAGTVYLGVINITPTVIKQAGNGTVMVWTSSHWICTVAGNAQFETKVLSPSGVNEIVSIGPASSYSAAAPSGPEYNIVTFASNAMPISRMVPGNWPIVISKFAGTATIVPNALGAIQKGNVVLATLG